MVWLSLMGSMSSDCKKSLLNFIVNAGIYLLQPSVYEYIPNNEYFDMTSLIQKLLDDNRKVASFLVLEYWLDIGQMADYEQAQRDAGKGGLK